MHSDLAPWFSSSPLMIFRQTSPPKNKKKKTKNYNCILDLRATPATGLRTGMLRITAPVLFVMKFEKITQ